MHRMVKRVARVVVLALPVAWPAILCAQVIPSSSVKPPCPVAEDEKYGYSAEQPVQVGGSPVFGAARQRRYLDTLRGLEGQPVQYKRSGQARGDDDTILDAYVVSYAGLEKPVTLYLDWYHFNTPKAPRGFTCAGPFGLTNPPPSPFLEMDDVRYVAIAQGESKAFEPIPLGGEGAARRGVAYDRFRLLALAAREAVAKNTKLDPQKLGPAMMPGTVFVAFPLTCGERIIRATAIDIVALNGSVMPAQNRREVSGDQVGPLLHGAQTPAGSFAIVAQLTSPRPNDTVRITYAEPACGVEGNQVSVPLAFTPPKAIEMPQPALPEGVTTADPVLVQVLVDLDGAIQRPSYVGGPQDLFRAAVDAVTRWRFEPARINGAAIANGLLLQVRFSSAR
jgi:hypothetical protein